MSETMLSVRGLRKAFAATRVLRELELDASAGEITAVLGRSGCGKTTLLRSIAGFEHIDAGSIEVGGVVVCDARTHLAPERRKVGVVAQEGALFPHLNVAANVGFGLPRSERRSARAGRVEQLLDLVGLRGLGGRYPHELSGGQQQRVALARALAPGPRLVLLDEPFDALDASLRGQLREEVCATLRASGATVLLVTHDQQEALSLADVVAVMRDGAIVQSADPRTLYRDPLDAELASFLGDAVLLAGELFQDGVRTALGGLRTRGTRDASQRTATAMLRPEQILCGAPGAGLAGGRVIGVRFYGHDAAIEVELIDSLAPSLGGAGLRLLARAAGYRLPLVGDEVSLRVEGSALLLARDAASAGHQETSSDAPARVS